MYFRKKLFKMDQTKIESTKQQAKPDLTSSTANQQTNNPISRKLNKILESRIENDKVNILTK